VSQKTLKVTETRTFEVTHDAESKILKGYINRSAVESDTSFKWFKENMKYGTADAAAVQAFKTNGNNVHFVVFGGTWCHDTQNLLPVFYRLADKGGITEDKITLIGVDRAKTALNEMHKAFKITNVPTFIVMKDGKEIGRVVEYGKHGAIDKELGEIVATATSN
jgi:thiol-disulfide isomerase/thioredoxin